jgi:hypothetical protein
MRKIAYFDPFPTNGWPDTKDLEPYFIAPPGKQWTYPHGMDNWVLSAEGLYGTEHLQPKTGRVDVHLYMVGNPQHGVTFAYQKWDGREQRKTSYSSKGDLGHRLKFVRSLHGDLMSVGLFVPFRDAWRAVKEFIETDGELPTSIEWVRAGDLPEDTFPPAWTHPEVP